MAFRNPIIGGNNTLVRQAMQSENYQAATSGWRIERDGSAEFNNIVARGTVEVGTPPNPQVIIDSAGGLGRIRFPSGSDDETEAAKIESGVLNPDDPLEAVTTTLSSAGMSGTPDRALIIVQSNTADLTQGPQIILDQAGQANITMVDGRIILNGEVMGAGQYIEKSSAQNATSATLANVIGMNFEVAAAAKYEVRLRVAYDGPTSTDIQIDWTGPAGFTMDRNILAPQLGTADNQNTAVTSIRRAATTAQQAGTPGGVANAFTVWWEDAIATVGATAGTVQLRFARVSGAGTITLQAASYMIVTRVA